MRKLFLFCFMVMLLALPKLSFAEEEELAPGFNLCMHSATSAYFMMQCGNDAYAYWEEKLHNRYKLLRSICSGKESNGIQEECTETLARLEKSSNEYIESMRNLILLLSDDEDGKMSDLDTLGLKIDATKQQVKNFAVLPYFADVDTAETMFNNLVALWEHGAVQSFDVLTDEILDQAVMAVYHTGNSPLDGSVYLTRGNNPNFFKGDKANYDLALRRTDAAKIAVYYFGKPAPLKNVQSEYLLGNQADGPLLCRGKIDNLSALENGFAIKGALLCIDDPFSEQEKEVHTADMEIAFEKTNYSMAEEDNASHGFVVRSLHIMQVKAE